MGQTQALLQDAHRFGPAAPDERHVYGSCAPGWHAAGDHETCVREWIADMQTAGIERVCSLLAATPAEATDGTLGLYEDAFGPDRTLHAAVPRDGLVDAELLETKILPFLEAARDRDEPVVVHGLSGLDRTGQVLAAWLTSDRQYRPERAVSTVHSMGRDPLGDRDREENAGTELFEALQQVRATPTEY